MTCATGDAEALSKDHLEQPDMQMQDRVKTDERSEKQQPSLNMFCNDAKVSEEQFCEQQTGQLMKEVRPAFTSFLPNQNLKVSLCLFEVYSVVKQLEQTQKELSRLQQLNKSLQVELQQERKSRPQVR